MLFRRGHLHLIATTMLGRIQRLVGALAQLLGVTVYIGAGDTGTQGAGEFAVGCK